MAMLSVQRAEVVKTDARKGRHTSLKADAQPAQLVYYLTKHLIQ